MSDAAPLILNVFASFAVGGPQVRFAALAQRFGAAFRHAVIAMDGNLQCAARLPASMPVGYPSCRIGSGSFVAHAWALRAVLRRLRPDLLVTSNWGSIEWALANAPSLVRHIHIEDGFGPEERATQLRRRVLARRLLLRRCTVVVPSQTLYRLAVEVWQLPPHRVRLIPNGIDLTRFQPAPRPVRAGGELVIGTVAALRPEKNLGRLLHAFRSLLDHAPARLVIVGDGPERPALEDLATSLGLRDRVQFAGHAADPAAAYRGFDVFALSSDTEQMPLSVLEAMAAGLPVAATDVGDVGAMLAAENAGFVVPAEVGALAGSLRALLAAEPLRRQLGAANRRKAERDYDQEAMFAAYRNLFEGRDAASGRPE